MKLIDADAFLKEYCEPYPHIYQAMSSAFKHAPKVDAEPVRHGKWGEGSEDYSDDFIVCSVCGEAFNVMDNDTYRFDYCPHCGTRMDGKG